MVRWDLSLSTYYTVAHPLHQRSVVFLLSSLQPHDGRTFL